MEKKKNIFLKNINKYYEKKKQNMAKIIDLTDEYNYKFSYDNNKKKHLLNVYDKNNNFVFQSNYEIVGLYNIGRSVWYWAYNVSMIDNSLSNKSKKIIELSKDIFKNYNKYNSREVDLYYYYSSNSNFMINFNNILTLLKLGAYYMNSDWILPIKKKIDDSIDSIEYISIYNISKLK